MRTQILICCALVTSALFPAPSSTAAGLGPVVLIVMENHSYGPADPGVAGNTAKYIVGNPDAPYINDTLIPGGTLFTNYDAIAHPSLPNYLHLTAGTDAGCVTNGCSPDSIGSENLFDLLGGAGLGFASFAQSMPVNCYPTNAIPYVRRHNPEVYFSDLDASAGAAYGCDVTDVPFPSTWPDPLPAFSLVVPDICHDMHGTSATGACPGGTDQIVKDGDAWLSQTVPALLAEGALVIVTFDEGSDTDATGGGGHVPMIMVGANAQANQTDATPYTHHGVLAGLQDAFGLWPLLGAAATATPVSIPTGTPFPAPTVTGVTPGSGKPGDQIAISGTNLWSVFAVRFAGGVSSVFTSVDDTTVTATVPQGAISGPITVSTAGGSAASPTDFEVDQVPPAPITLVQHVLSRGKSASAAAAWAQTTGSGDLLTATIAWGGSATATPPPGWVHAATVQGTAIYYREGAPPQSGSTAFTLSASSNWVLDISEWSGVVVSAALDRTATNSSKSLTSTVADSGTTAATSQPSELAIAVIKDLSVATQSNPTNGFSVVDVGTQGSSNTTGTYSKILSLVGQQNVSVTLGAAVKWRGAIATFRGA